MELNLKEFSENHKRLGKGGFGNVYLFTSKINPNIKIAVKDLTYKDRLNIDDEGAELKEVGSLVSKYIVSILGLDVVQFDEAQKKPTFRIYMEYCDGDNITHYLEEMNKLHKRVPESEVLKILTHSLLGLCYLHRNNRIHRDIKPDNIMCREGVWKLGDLGMIQLLPAHVDVVRNNAGSFGYCAPETIVSQEGSKAADIFSLGMTFLALVLSKGLYEKALEPYARPRNTAFEERRRGEAIARIREYFYKEDFKYTWPSDIYSEDLKKLIESMIDKNPSQRPTVEQLLEHPLIKKAVADNHLEYDLYLVKQEGLENPNDNKEVASLKDMNSSLRLDIEKANNEKENLQKELEKYKAEVEKLKRILNPGFSSLDNEIASVEYTVQSLEIGGNSNKENNQPEYSVVSSERSVVYASSDGSQTISTLSESERQNRLMKLGLNNGMFKYEDEKDPQTVISQVDHKVMALLASVFRKGKHRIEIHIQLPHDKPEGGSSSSSSSSSSTAQGSGDELERKWGCVGICDSNYLKIFQKKPIFFGEEKLKDAEEAHLNIDPFYTENNNLIGTAGIFSVAYYNNGLVKQGETEIKGYDENNKSSQKDRGNEQYGSSDCVFIELDMDSHVMTFFRRGARQPVVISDIPNSVTAGVSLDKAKIKMRYTSITYLTPFSFSRLQCHSTSIKHSFDFNTPAKQRKQIDIVYNGGVTDYWVDPDDKDTIITEEINRENEESGGYLPPSSMGMPQEDIHRTVVIDGPLLCRLQNGQGMAYLQKVLTKGVYRISFDFSPKVRKEELKEKNEKGIRNRINESELSRVAEIASTENVERPYVGLLSYNKYKLNNQMGLGFDNFSVGMAFTGDIFVCGKNYGDNKCFGKNNYVSLEVDMDNHLCFFFVGKRRSIYYVTHLPNAVVVALYFRHSNGHALVKEFREIHVPSFQLQASDKGIPFGSCDASGTFMSIPSSSVEILYDNSHQKEDTVHWLDNKRAFVTLRNTCYHLFQNVGNTRRYSFLARIRSDPNSIDTIESEEESYNSSSSSSSQSNNNWNAYVGISVTPRIVPYSSLITYSRNDSNYSQPPACPMHNSSVPFGQDGASVAVDRDGYLYIGGNSLKFPGKQSNEFKKDEVSFEIEVDCHHHLAIFIINGVTWPVIIRNIPEVFEIGVGGSTKDLIISADDVRCLPYLTKQTTFSCYLDFYGSKKEMNEVKEMVQVEQSIRTVEEEVSVTEEESEERKENDNFMETVSSFSGGSSSSNTNNNDSNSSNGSNNNEFENTIRSNSQSISDDNLKDMRCDFLVEVDRFEVNGGGIEIVNKSGLTSTAFLKYNITPGMAVKATLRLSNLTTNVADRQDINNINSIVLDPFVGVLAFPSDKDDNLLKSMLRYPLGLTERSVGININNLMMCNGEQWSRSLKDQKNIDISGSVNVCVRIEPYGNINAQSSLVSFSIGNKRLEQVVLTKLLPLFIGVTLSLKGSSCEIIEFKTYEPESTETFMFKQQEKNLTCTSSLFTYRNTDLVVNNNNFRNINYFNREDCKYCTGLLPTTLLFHSDYAIGIPLTNFNLKKGDVNSGFYRFDVLVVKATGVSFEDFVGVGDNDAIRDDSKKFSSPFGNRQFTIGYTSKGKVRNSRNEYKSGDDFEWKDGDVISIEINGRDKQIAFLRNNSVVPVIVVEPKTFPDNLIVAVGASNKGALFHILRFGEVQSLKYLTKFKEIKKKI